MILDCTEVLKIAKSKDLQIKIEFGIYCRSSANAFASGAGGLRFKSRASQIGQCCQWLATATAFLRKKLYRAGAMTRRWVSETRYTLRHSTASIMKD